MLSTGSDFFFFMSCLVSVGLPRSLRFVVLRVFIFADTHGETAGHDHFRTTQCLSVHMQSIITMTRVPPPSWSVRKTKELTPLALSMMEINVVAPPVRRIRADWRIKFVFLVRTPTGTDLEGREYDESGTTIVTKNAAELTVLTTLVYSMKPRTLDKFMDVTDVKASDKDGFFVSQACHPKQWTPP